MCRESPCLCSRCRISPSRTASAARSSSTLWKILMPTSFTLSPPACLRNCGSRPCYAMWRATRRMGGLCTRLVFDRNTAYRFGISPSTIDQTLYDAYGQREVSTIYTQLNQYHVVLEVDPDYRRNPLDLRDLIHSHQRLQFWGGFLGVGLGGLGRHPVVRTDQFADRRHYEPFQFHFVLGPFQPPSPRITPLGGRRSLRRRRSPMAGKCRWRPSPTWRKPMFPSP